MNTFTTTEISDAPQWTKVVPISGPTEEDIFIRLHLQEYAHGQLYLDAASRTRP